MDSTGSLDDKIDFDFAFFSQCHQTAMGQVQCADVAERAN